MATKDDMTAEEEVWDLRLDEIPLARISDWTGLPPKDVRRVLAGGVPERFRDDERRLPYEQFWLPVSGPCPTLEGRDAALVIVRRDKAINRAGRGRTMTALRRAFSVDHPGASISPYGLALEALETRVCAAMVVKRGYPGYAIEKDGLVRRLTAEDFPGYVPEPLDQMPVDDDLSGSGFSAP